MEKRKFNRFHTQLNATYTIPGSEPKDCKVTDVSREGTRVELLTSEKIDPTARIQLNILLPSDDAPVESTVLLKWIQEMDESDDGFRYLAGGSFEEIKLEDKWRLLDHAYDRFKQAKGKQ